jgi:hypothetical protein
MISVCSDSVGENIPVTCPGLNAVDVATISETNATTVIL